MAKNRLVRRWERTGNPPCQHKDQCYQSAYLFGAVCRTRGAGTTAATPFADTDVMPAHIEEIGRTVATGAHTVLFMNRAAWRTACEIELPDDITPGLPPPRTPDLNPVEHVRQCLRHLVRQ